MNTLLIINGSTLDRAFNDTVTAVSEALAREGFGVVSEIDMQATLRTKLGVETDPYLILGACNPAYAHRSLQSDPSIGLSPARLSRAAEIARSVVCWSGRPLRRREQWEVPDGT